MQTVGLRAVLKSSMALTLLALCAGVNATLTISSVVGGVPTGVNYANLNSLPLGAGGGMSGGIDVTFAGVAGAVSGSFAGEYAAPYLSNSNGALFGDPTVSGPDATTYVSSIAGNSTVTFAMPGPELYFGLLWGSVDTYNTLTFLNAQGNSVGTIVGTNVTANANGNQGAQGTFYVNINSSLPFTTVVASGGTFEIDNVAYNQSIPTAVPEPSTWAWMLVGIGSLGGCTLRRRKSMTSSAQFT
jgi:PEP-CTERM motif-containing protein